MKFMFTDGRSRRVVFIAHCFLNQNAISDGTAVYPAAFRELLAFFLDTGISIIQMPCPELCCLGLDRGNIHGTDAPVVTENTRIRKEMQQPAPQRTLAALVESTMQQIMEYYKHGFEIVGIIGVNRSPSCGVDTTSDNHMEISGKGLFMEELCRRLSEENLSFPMVGIKSTDSIAEKIMPLL